VNPGLNKNQAKLGIFVTTVLLKMLANSHGLLNKVVKIFGDGRAKSVGLKNTHDLASSDVLDLGNTMRITENNTDLTGS